MEHRALLLPVLRDFEKQAWERPCTRGRLEALEDEFEELLRRAREQGQAASVDVLACTLERADAVRAALHKGIAAHDLARSEILRVQQLIARGHMREAVIESVKIRNLVAGFSDLSLDFVAEAKAKHERRHRRLVTLGVLLAAGILVAATVIEMLRVHTSH